MKKHEWLNFLKNYYGYEFNISLEESAKNKIKYEKEVGLEITDFDVQLKKVAKARKNREDALKIFVDKSYKMLESYLGFGFEIQDYMDKNYFGKCKRSKLIKNIGDGFVLEIKFHISDICSAMNTIEVILNFPESVN